MKLRRLVTVVVTVIVVAAVLGYLFIGSSAASSPVTSASPGADCIPNSPEPSSACSPQQLDQKSEDWNVNGMASNRITINMVDESYIVLTSTSPIQLSALTYQGAPISSIVYSATVNFEGSSALKALNVLNVKTAVYMIPATGESNVSLGSAEQNLTNPAIPLATETEFTTVEINATEFQAALAGYANGTYTLEFFTSFSWTPVFNDPATDVPSPRNASFSASVPFILYTEGMALPRVCLTAAGVKPCIV